jgi:hypothetical protein
MKRVKESYLTLVVFWALAISGWSMMLCSSSAGSACDYRTALASFIFFPIWLFTFWPSTLLCLGLWLGAMYALQRYRNQHGIGALSGWDFKWIANVSLAATLISAVTVVPVGVLWFLGKAFGIYPGP